MQKFWKKGKFLVLLAFVCPLSIFGQDDPWAGDVHTVVLDADNLTAFVSSTRLCMVEFYTPWVSDNLTNLDNTAENHI